MPPSLTMQGHVEGMAKTRSRFRSFLGPDLNSRFGHPIAGDLRPRRRVSVYCRGSASPAAALAAAAPTKVALVVEVNGQDASACCAEVGNERCHGRLADPAFLVGENECFMMFPGLAPTRPSTLVDESPSLR